MQKIEETTFWNAGSKNQLWYRDLHLCTVFFSDIGPVYPAGKLYTLIYEATSNFTKHDILIWPPGYFFFSFLLFLPVPKTFLGESEAGQDSSRTKNKKILAKVILSWLQIYSSFRDWSNISATISDHSIYSKCW